MSKITERTCKNIRKFIFHTYSSFYMYTRLTSLCSLKTFRNRHIGHKGYILKYVLSIKSYYKYPNTGQAIMLKDVKIYI